MTDRKSNTHEVTVKLASLNRWHASCTCGWSAGSHWNVGIKGLVEQHVNEENTR